MFFFSPSSFTSLNLVPELCWFTRSNCVRTTTTSAHKYTRLVIPFGLEFFSLMDEIEMFFAFYTFNNFISRFVFIEQFEMLFLPILFFFVLFFCFAGQCSIQLSWRAQRERARERERTFLKVNYFSCANRRPVKFKNGKSVEVEPRKCVAVSFVCTAARWAQTLYAFYRLLMKKFLNWLKSHKKLFVPFFSS